MNQGPPVASYIFRGHVSPIQALHFFASNTLLASGDNEGWIVIWRISTKRPVAVWKAHEGGIMGLKDWHTYRLISHGRDHRLRVWQLRPEDYEGLSQTLPVDAMSNTDERQPWLLHSLSINALNYCAFSICKDDDDDDDDTDKTSANEDQVATIPLLLAASNGLDASGIDIFQLPSEHRVCKIAGDKNTQTGMVMAVSLFRRSTTKKLMLASGYETGHVLLHINNPDMANPWVWTKTVVDLSHTQPVLSIDTTLSGEHVYSSSADSVLAKYSIDSGQLVKKVDTKHAGQQDLKIRDDGKIIAAAGWDKRIRVYSTKTMKELAVLKWHQEGCYAIAFASTLPQADGSLDAKSGTALVKSPIDLLQAEQAVKSQGIRWLAGGAKDGKISLWDIY